MAATTEYDPAAPGQGNRGQALAYLKSRVDITAALGGNIMAGPIVFPYNVFPVTGAGRAGLERRAPGLGAARVPGRPARA